MSANNNRESATAATATTAQATPANSSTRSQCQCPHLGFALIFAGTVMTCIAYQSPESAKGTSIAGPCLLAVGIAMIFGCILSPLYQDWKENGANPNWKKRVQNDLRTLSWILIIPGIPLSCVGFNRNYSCHEPSPLALAGLSILGNGELFLLFGLIFGRCQQTSAATDVNVSTLTLCLRLRSDFKTLGLSLLLPGVCLSCVGWIQYYDCLIPGIIGAIFLTIGWTFVAASALTLWRSAKAMGKTVVERLMPLFFLCGIIMTPVGFTNMPSGLALGIIGSCFLVLTAVSYASLSCFTCLWQESTPNANTAELGRSNPLNRANVTTANPPAVARSGETNPPLYSISSRLTSTSTLTDDTSGLPNYADSVSMPAIEVAELVSPNGNLGSGSDPSAPPYNPAAQSETNPEEDEPPPPSYDEVMKGIEGVHSEHS